MSKPRVVVIGAGASGLACAQQLKDKADVVVVEGRSRVGGRIHTEHFPDGTFVDLGAAWVHGTGSDNPTMKMLQDMGVKVDDSLANFNPELVAAEGPAGALPETARNIGMCELMCSGWQSMALMRAMEAEMSRRQQAHPSEQDISLGEWVRTVKTSGCFGFKGMDALDGRARGIVGGAMLMLGEYGTGAKLEELSFTWFSEAERFGGQFKGNQMGIPMGGWGKFTDALSKGLNVRLDCPVKAVRAAGGGGVEVELRSGEVLPCSACVCTIPLGVLKANAVEFQPPLPAPKVEAIGKLGFGILNRVAVLFDRCFWDSFTVKIRLPMSQGRRHATSKEWPMWVDWKHFTGANALVAFFYNDVAEEAEQKSEEELAAWMKVLCASMWGKERVDQAKVLSVITSRWRSDEFSRGVYSNVALGSTPYDREEIAKPEGSVFFAGEHTINGRGSTVDGAYASGQRAASEVIAHLVL